jgi:hypothetical protein
MRGQTMIFGRPATVSVTKVSNPAACLVSILTVCLAVIGYASVCRADSLSVESDASTLAAPSSAGWDTGDVTGLSFQPALEGGFGSFTSVPPGAPAGAEVVSIPPGDGESGFFEVSFNLPDGFSEISLTGSANIDDVGRAFLNGNPISPSISSGDPETITEFGNATFSTSDSSLFNPGANVLLFSDDNSGGGPSAGAFFATVTFSVPEPGSLCLIAGASSSLLSNRRRRKARN